MSSDDVIELGSSDEDTEPAPKKIKPMPDAMVCIPSKLHGVTIKPAKPDTISIAKEFLGKAITVKKVMHAKPQVVNRNKLNGKATLTKSLGQPISKPKIAYNPMSGLQKPIIVSNKPGNSKVALIKTTNLKTVVGRDFTPLLKKPIQIQNTLNLPPSITVKKTLSNRPIVMLNVKSKKLVNQNQRKVGGGEVLTVELDDDEAPPHKSSPQWYLRPEDQKEQSILEEENNKEPEAPKLIEITIEESPIKAIPDKRTHEIGAELSITIEDSPVKVVGDNKMETSDNEEDISDSKVPHSKKRLKYPIEEENRKIVEIEIAPFEISRTIPEKAVGSDKNVVESDLKVVESDQKVVESDSLPPKQPQAMPSHTEALNIKLSQSTAPSEFHPVYQSFIDLCFHLENSDDMKKIVDKKIIGYYKQVPKEYTESEEFIDMVSSKILLMKAGPEKMYLFIKDIVDELNLQRKLTKAQPIKEPPSQEQPQSFGDEYDIDTKHHRQIRKLEKTIKKLHRAIQKLEEQEVDFDDEDDSVYLLTERYKERMVRVYAKFCQLSNTKMPSEPRIQIDARPGQPTGPAKRLEKWVNKKVPIGTPLPFPDFHDVLRCVREANEEDKLDFNEADIMEEARDLFTRCGKKLQRRRQENEWRLAASRIAQEIDPAENSDELKKKLNDNKKVASQKETDIFNKYADRQNQLKLEGEEIGDKEAEESPVESEEEETNEDSTSLENTEKRKERLKRLLQEKSRKVSEEKENQPSNKDELDDYCETLQANVEIASKEENDDKEPPEKKDDDAKENTEQPNKVVDNPQDATETLSLSDDSNELESDIDELHLLQKLHSGNEEQSSSDSTDLSDSDSPIAISDSLESGDDNKKQTDCDVISIENSSYSEDGDGDIDNMQTSQTDSVQVINDDSVPRQVVKTAAKVNEMEVDIPSAEIAHAPTQSNNDEYTESVENILLASSEDDNSQAGSGVSGESVCVNLRDELISIDETVVGTNQVEQQSSPAITNNISNDNEISSVDINSGNDNMEKELGTINAKSNNDTTEINDIVLDAQVTGTVQTTNNGEKVSNEMDIVINIEKNFASASLEKRS